jgi:dTDP-4-dehydrorhamnose reductase
MRVFVLGATGMLGHAVMREFPNAERPQIDARKPTSFGAGAGDYIINCIGLIPQKKPAAVDMIAVNSLFPHWLAENSKARIIQIGTDCVFSGRHGSYTERQAHSATDTYGQTKSMGEPENAMILRTSIVGWHPLDRASLAGWIRSQPENAAIDGWINHAWNGITTDAFARITRAIIEQDLFGYGVQHLVPADVVSKNALVKSLAERIGRHDLKIQPRIQSPSLNRTLSTIFPEYNLELWEAAGYYEPPRISRLIREMQCI